MAQELELVTSRYAAREAVVRAFFAQEASRLAKVCHTMARRFIRGGRLVAFGVGAAATDAQHVSVEFVHPVIVGKRALPAFALPNDIASTTGLALDDPGGFLATQVRVLGAAEDIAMGMLHAEDDPAAPAVHAALKQADAVGILPILLTAVSNARDLTTEHVFGVPSDDPFIVQEVHETLYHVLWELVHVFFEHKGLLEDRPRGASHDTGGSRFLYPFLSERESDLDAVLEDLQRSIVAKAEDVIALRAAHAAGALVEAARLVGERVDSGGKVLVFGNGGSATDAQDLAGDLVAPSGGAPPIPALSLTNDAAVVTAVGNDVGFDNVFARQVISYASEGDVAIAISTSGGSRNVLAAVEEAKRRGLLTVGLAGYGGGRLAEMCDHSLVIDADYIPRIQEAQASQYHVLRGLLEPRGR